jgi:tRNA threonylcarbamoyladenosine biosynthesis protein TsaE
MAIPIARHPLLGVHPCACAADTRRLAARLAAGLDGPAVIALEGPLGAGKTEFVKGLAEGLVCGEVPTSPTFAVAHEYPGGRLPLFHFDFFRLESGDEVRTSGFGECVGEGVVAVEWAGRFPAWLPGGVLRVGVEFDDGGGRVVTIS